MKRQTVVFVLLIALAFNSSALAQSNLPPEARAQIIISEVESALALT